ncbi:MAG: DUF692 domain-containing protein [Vicinamibacterales bacterium]
MVHTGATTAESTDRIRRGAGVGLRLPHLMEVVATRPPVSWFEIHPENVLANPHAHELLLEIARHYPISVHTVGVSIGSSTGLDREHIARVRELADEVNAVLVSGHLAWSTHKGEYLNDLLPLPYDEETLDLVTRQLVDVQEALGRPFLVENPSSYFGFGHSTMTEVEFLRELVHRTGCGLLCDVSNVHLSAHNIGYDAYAYLDAMPAHAVRELHLGGFTPEADAANADGLVLIDTHADRVAEPVWQLYAYAVRLFGQQPTLIEWDNEIPSLDTLVAEAARANRVAGADEGAFRAIAG